MKSCELLVSDTSEYFVYAPSRTARDLFFYPLQCGFFCYEAGYHLERESYDSFLLLYLQKGQLQLCIDGQTQTVDTDHFALIDCYHPHAYTTETGCECLWCHFDGPLARAWYENIIGHTGNVITLADTYPARKKMAAVYDVFASGSPVREPLMSKYLSDILTDFLLNTADVKKIHPYTSMVEEIITYIHEHFKDDITVGQMAALADLSPYHFLRIFKQETGFTPHEYLIHVRMSTAKYLLKNTSLSVKAICFQSGFSGESVFCTAFKRMENVTPEQYRNCDQTTV